jgi:hypothetical protein
MKTIIIIVLLLASTASAQTSKPFEYKGNGKWETTTDIVKQIDKKLEDLQTVTAENDELKQQKVIYQTINDSLESIIANYQKIVKKKDEIIMSKMDLIQELVRPVMLKEDNPPLIKFNGVFANIGSEYDNREKFDVKTLTHYISIDASITIANKVRLAGEQRYPFYSTVKLGIGF